MITVKDQEILVSGKINYDNAEAYYQQGLSQILAIKRFPLVLNLAGLEQGSTLALAVMVQWLRQTPDIDSLHFKSVPDKMMKIIQSCHLEDDLKLI